MIIILRIKRGETEPAVERTGTKLKNIKKRKRLRKCRAKRYRERERERRRELSRLS